MEITYEWRGAFGSSEVNGLHAEGFGHDPAEEDWATRLHRHCLGWVCARLAGQLVGFVAVAWDGGRHAFILDTVVTPRLQRRGIATELVAVAARAARAAKCEWLHVDFEDHLAGFYRDACGFRPTRAGLLPL